MLLGGAVILLASFVEKGRRIGFYPSAMLMYAGLALLIEAKTSFAFFAAWEVLTVGSYFLILRGKLSEPHALSYILFSLGGAFALLGGFALAAGGVQPFALEGLRAVPVAVAPLVFILLAAGFMTKTASIGLHIWLPGAHAEAETDVSPMVSGILLKAGLFGLWLLLTHMGHQTLYGVDLTHVLVWIGALSAFIGAVLAVFQEDAKRLLAYSSISQMGYALFGLALMTHLGWLLALMFVINHYLYKSMLFLAVGGVYKRTHTKLMYKMGGLITLMPFTFVSVLVGIIAMSGVPPLSGFGGRWIFYQAILDGGQKLPAGAHLHGRSGRLPLPVPADPRDVPRPAPRRAQQAQGSAVLGDGAADAVRRLAHRLRRAAGHGAATGRRLSRYDLRRSSPDLGWLRRP